MRITAGPEVTVPIDRIELCDAARYRSEDLHPAWRTLRAEAPVWRHQTTSGAAVWSVTRHADCQQVLKDHAAFTSERGTIVDVIGVGDRAGGITIALTDPPRHTLLRGPVMRLLSRWQKRQAPQATRTRVRRAVEPCFEAGTHDFAELVRDLPMALIGDLVGIPESEWRDVAFWTMAAIAPEDPTFSVGNRMKTMLRAHHELFDRIAEVVRWKRATPGDDLISVLLGIDLEGGRMSDSDISSNCYSLVMGANNTTPQVACHLLLALIERPQLWQEIAADQSLAPGAVEEGFRWSSPTNHFVRHAVVDVTLRGTPIAAGEAVCAWIASANRDESVFADPYRFDPRRTPNPHLAFGAGAHYCVGAPMSRASLVALLEELTGGVDHFELAGEVRHLHCNFINGITHMPVRTYPRV